MNNIMNLLQRVEGLKQIMSSIAGLNLDPANNNSA